MVRVRPEDGDVSARRLTEAMAGHDPALPPTAAIPLLAAADLPAARRLDLYRSAVHDTRIEDAVRLQALRALVRESPAEAAVADVREVVSTAGDGPLVAGAAGLLARLGGPDDLRVLGNVGAGLGPGDPQRRVGFAVSVLAHRHGLPDPSAHLRAPSAGDDDPGPDALRVSSVPLTGDPRDRAVAVVAAEAPLEADGTPEVVSVAFGHRSVVLVLRDGLDGGARLARTPDLPAVVLTTDPEHGDLDPAFFVLTEPAGDDLAGDDMAGDDPTGGDPAGGDVLVQVCRPDGDPVLAGRGTVDDTGLRVRLTGVRAPGSIPAALDVTLRRSGSAVTGLVGRHRHDKRVPTRLPD